MAALHQAICSIACAGGRPDLAFISRQRPSGVVQFHWGVVAHWDYRQTN